MVGAIVGQGVLTESSWPFHIIDLNCTGSELTLFECPHNNLVGLHNCIATHDASVRCQGKLCYQLSAVLYDCYNICLINIPQQKVLTSLATARMVKCG